MDGRIEEAVQMILNFHRVGLTNQKQKALSGKLIFKSRYLLFLLGST
jgi:hypothetical protein